MSNYKIVKFSVRFKKLLQLLALFRERISNREGLCCENVAIDEALSNQLFESP